jgi:hypothetical protein
MKRIIVAAMAAMFLIAATNAEALPDTSYVGTTTYVVKVYAPAILDAPDTWNGEGVIYRTDTTAWNWIQVCASELVTGGWQQYDCTGTSNDSRFTGIQYGFTVPYGPLVPNRWYATWAKGHVLWTGGWNFATVRSAGICFRSNGAIC